jgi:hypothetical protein
MMDRGTLRNTYVEFHSKNKFKKCLHLVDFIVTICHDARSHERKKNECKIYMFFSDLLCSLVILNGDFLDFHQSRQENTATVPQIRQRTREFGKLESIW